MKDYTATIDGAPITEGAIVTTNSGETCEFVCVSRGKNHCGTAKVIVKNSNGTQREYYHHVFRGMDVVANQEAHHEPR